jgi:hypothetical protein
MAAKILLVLIIVGFIYARHKVNKLHHSHRFVPVVVKLNFFDSLHYSDQNTVQ